MSRGGQSFPKLTIRDVPLDEKTVLVRVDYNVPLDHDGEIEDDYRIQQSLPTLQYLLDRKCKIVLCAHLGRPDGKRDKKFSLAPVATRLGELLGHHVNFVPDCIGDVVRQAVKQEKPGRIILLENLRFHGGEEANDSGFAKALISDSGASYFVQDGFGVVHRAHASTAAITAYAPSVAGLLLEKEYTVLTGVMHHPKRPMVSILGGAKISDKITVIERLVAVSDTVIIGGAMANTFLKYQGKNVGKSLYEDGLEPIVKKIYETVEKKVGKEAIDDFLLLPTDVAVATDMSPEARRSVVSVDNVKDNEYILDIGHDTIDSMVSAVQGVATVVWSGTLGYAELPQFAHGSARLALLLASSTDTISVIGGGDTADFVLHWDAKKGGSFTHVSTGGSASLELMAGQPMPGIDALMDA